TMVITGKILAALDGDVADSTRQLALWSLVPAEKADCYRKVTVEHIAGSIMERKYCFPNAFVVDYREEYGDVEGTGTFTLTVKQKKDKIGGVAVEGNYSAE
ncbi:MAG: membrane-associated protease 1, partial [Butyrivibrio sp.]|nr:membrane-associated protease 1 [Butyrivibrio sp.]